MATINQSPAAPVTGYYTQSFVDYQAYYTLVKAMVEEYNAARDYDFIARTVQDGTQLRVRHWQRSAEMVSIPEFYQPDRERLGFWVIDAPLLNFAVGYGFSLFAWQDMTLGEADKITSEMIRADERLQAKMAYNIMMHNGAGTQVGGSFAASGAWNGATSGLTPPPYKAVTFAASHSHYTATGVANVRLQDIHALYEDIIEHGYSEDNVGLMMVISQNMATDIKNLAGWTAAMTANPVVSTISTEGLRSGLSIAGFEVFIDQWVPKGYLLGMSTQQPPVFRRVPQNPAGQGLQFVKGNNSDNPFLGSYYVRRQGNVVSEKGAISVRQVTTGAYANPSFKFDYASFA